MRPSSRAAGRSLLSAFEALIKERGGEIRTGADVASIIQSGGRATGVRLASGETITADKGVICSVTPTQLYGRLLGKDAPKPSHRSDEEISLRQGQFPDPLCARQAAGLARRGARRRGAPASDARPRRRVQGQQRGGARHAAGSADHLRRPAACARPVALPARQGDPVAAASRGAAHRQGRCGRDDCRARRRHAGPRRCARPMPTASRRSSRSTSTASPTPSSRATPIRRPISRR